MKGGSIIQHSLKETPIASPLLSAPYDVLLCVAYITSAYQSMHCSCTFYVHHCILLTGKLVPFLPGGPCGPGGPGGPAGPFQPLPAFPGCPGGPAD